MLNFFRKKLNPSDACNQARALVSQGKVDEAFRLYETVLRDHPDFSLAYADRGTVYAMIKNHSKAIEDLNKAVQLGYNFSSVFTTLATIYLELQDHQSSLNNFEKAAALDPNNALIYYNRSLVYYQLGKKELALSDLRKCQEFGPDPSFSSAIQKRINLVSAQA